MDYSLCSGGIIEKRCPRRFDCLRFMYKPEKGESNCWTNCFNGIAAIYGCDYFMKIEKGDKVFTKSYMKRSKR